MYYGDNATQERKMRCVSMRSLRKQYTGPFCSYCTVADAEVCSVSFAPQVSRTLAGVLQAVSEGLSKRLPLPCASVHTKPTIPTTTIKLKKSLIVHGGLCDRSGGDNAMLKSPCAKARSDGEVSPPCADALHLLITRYQPRDFSLKNHSY